MDWLLGNGVGNGLSATRWITALSFILLLSTTPSAARSPPQVTSQSERRLTEEAGSTVRIVCHVQSEPPPIIEWRKWNEAIQDDESINGAWDRFRTINTALRIKDVTPEDSGRYTCKAANGFGSLDVDYWLHVKANGSDSIPPWEKMDGIFDPQGGAPHFQKKEQMEHIVERPIGSVVRLRCKASGRPKPSIIWFKDGSAFTEDTSGTSPEHKWSITLEDLGTEDSGRYTCKVFNRHGSINHTYILQVRDRIASKPEIIQPHPRNTTVAFGDSAMFQCRVSSDVQPTIQWLKRVDNEVDARNKNHTITIKGQEFIVLQTSQVWPSSDGTHYLNKLTLHRVTEYDSGMYICLGINSVGHSFKPAYLTVLPNPDKLPADHYDYSTHLQSPSLPLIIGVPAIVIIIIAAIAIYILQRKRCQQRNQRPVTTVVARQHRMAPPPLTAQEKMYAEQYTALQPHHHSNGLPPNGNYGNIHVGNGMQGHMMPQTPSRYNITPYDLHSDISIAKMGAVPPPSSHVPVHSSVVQPLTQNHLNHHNNHGTLPYNTGHYYSTYDNC